MPSMLYDYKVRDRDGKLIKSQIEADSISLVAAKLRQMGYIPIDIKAVNRTSMKREIEIPGLTDRVSMKEVAIMSRQLATMVAAGLTLVRSLGILGDQLESKQLRTVLNQVRTDVEQGSSLSHAMLQHPKIFSPLYISMVRAGEAGGQLDLVLLKLSTTIEKQVELRHKVKSAMTYPAVVICAVILIVTLMMILVVPTFKNLFSTLHGSLPLPTQIVIGISNVVASIWLLVVIGAIIAIVVLFRRWINTEHGRDLWDRFKLRPPVFGALVHKVCLARLAGTLSSLTSAGVPIIESLEICSENVGNTVVSKAVLGAISGVREGRALSSCLADYKIMPVMVTQMIETGEESGALDTMLEKIGNFYDNEIEATVDSLTSILEPIIILFMGACIGTIVISLYLPMFDYVKLIHPA